MLVKNYTAGTLKLRNGSYKVELLPMQTTVVDEFKMPAAYIKKVYGQFVQIVTGDDEQEVAQHEVLPNETKGDLAPEKSGEAIPAVDAAPAKKEETVTPDVTDSAAGVADENVGNDGNAPEPESVEGDKEVKEEAEGQEPEAKKEDAPKAKKGGRKKTQK